MHELLGQHHGGLLQMCLTRGCEVWEGLGRMQNITDIGKGSRMDTYDPHQTHIESVALYGCPNCGSEDLGFCGNTEERTHADVTDVIECESCDWQWTRPEA